MKPYKISVILAAYHGEAYIGEQLKSLFTQTRPPDEIVIGDDSADDATHLAIESVKHEYNGELRYIKNEPRRGFLQNFVNLAREATGDMIFFCDQDDVWLPGKIEFLSGYLEQNPDVEVVACESEMVDAERKPYNRTVLDWVSDLPQKTAEINAGGGIQYILNSTILFSGHNMAIRRSFLPLFLQITDIYTYHDYWIALVGIYFGSFRFINKVFTQFRVHSTNAVTPFLRENNQTLWSRFQNICKSSDDIFRIETLLGEFYKFAQSHSDNPNFRMVKNSYIFYSIRAKILRKNRFVRWFFLLIYGPVYFSRGTGLRSFIRDFLASEIREQRK